jgi:hypothetical protein
VFRTLNPAAVQVDQWPVTEAQRFSKLAVVGLISAVRIMQIVNARDGRTGQSTADAIDPVHTPVLTALNGRFECRTETLKNPHPFANLAWFGWIVPWRACLLARLGRWSGSTSRGYKPAGPKTIARASPISMASLRGGTSPFIPQMCDRRRLQDRLTESRHYPIHKLNV